MPAVNIGFYSEKALNLAILVKVDIFSRRHTRQTRHRHYFPQTATTKPAPADKRTSRTGTECPVGAPRKLGSVEKEYCVLAMQTGSLP